MSETTDDSKYKEFEAAAEKQRALTVLRVLLVYAVQAAVVFVLCLIMGLSSGGKTTWTSGPFTFALLNWIFIMLGSLIVMLPLSIVIAVIITNKKIQAIREQYSIGEWRDTVTVAGTEQIVKHKMDDEEKILANKVLMKSLMICVGIEFAADILSIPMIFLMPGYSIFYGVAGVYIVAVVAMITSYNRGCVNFAKAFNKAAAAETPSEIRHKMVIRGILISIAHCLFAYVLILVATSMTSMVP